MVRATAFGVAGFGVSSLTRSPRSWPVSRSTMPPLIPLPPTSTPKPLRGGISDEALVGPFIESPRRAMGVVKTLMRGAIVGQAITQGLPHPERAVMRWVGDHIRESTGAPAVGGRGARPGGGRVRPAAAERGLRHRARRRG